MFKMLQKKTGSKAKVVTEDAPDHSGMVHLSISISLAYALISTSCLAYSCASALTPALSICAYNYSDAQLFHGITLMTALSVLLPFPIQVLGMTDRPRALLAAYVCAHVLACAAFHHYLGGLQWPLALMRVRVSGWDILTRNTFM